MKARKIMCVFLVPLLFMACDEIEDMVKFHVNDKTTIHIESTALDLPLNVPTPDVTSNSQQQYENNQTHADLVKDVKLEQLRLTLTHPDTKTFSFLKSIQIFISTDQHEEIVVASLMEIQATTSTIELVPTSQKLDAYMKADAYTLRTEVVTRESLTESVDIDVDLKFLVTANTF